MYKGEKESVKQYTDEENENTMRENKNKSKNDKSAKLKNEYRFHRYD